MSKFKVGDRVVCTGEYEGNHLIISYGWKIFKTREYETLKHGEVIGGIEYKGEAK